MKLLIDHINFLIRLSTKTENFYALSATKQNYSMSLAEAGLVKSGSALDDQANLIMLTDKGRNLLTHIVESAQDYLVNT